MTPVQRLREAIELVLIFHAEGPFTVEHVRRWVAITGDDAATTKAMCDHLRRVLAETDQAAISASADP